MCRPQQRLLQQLTHSSTSPDTTKKNSAGCARGRQGNPAFVWRLWRGAAPLAAVTTEAPSGASAVHGQCNAWQCSSSVAGNSRSCREDSTGQWRVDASTWNLRERCDSSVYGSVAQHVSQFVLGLTTLECLSCKTAREAAHSCAGQRSYQARTPCGCNIIHCYVGSGSSLGLSGY